MAQYIVNAAGALHSVNPGYQMGPGERSATPAEIAAYQERYETADNSPAGSYPRTEADVPVHNPPTIDGSPYGPSVQRP